MSEIEQLLRELQEMNKGILLSKKNILNSIDVWKHISNKTWREAGFESEEEVKEWILENPYLSIL